MTLLTPMPDEALLSIIQRLVVLDRAATGRKAAKRLFNSSSLQFCSTFPSVIPTLASELNCPAEYWVKHHSALPHYRLFTPKARFLNALSHFERGEGEKVFKDLSLIANRQCSGLKMRFCPQCAIEDKEAYGFSYWHVKHQLSGTFVCLRHKIPLINQSISRKRFDNWPCCDVAGRRLATEIELKLVRFAGYFQYHHPKRCRNSLSEIYKARLHKMGFLTKCAHVRLKPLRNSMIEALEPVLDYSEVRGIFNDARYPLYPSCILINRDAAISPLKHLLMMTFLFDSVSDLMNNDIGYSPELAQVNTRAKEQENDETANITHALKRGDSLRCIASTTGHSIAYVKKVAITAGVVIETREQKLFATERRQIAVKLLAGKATGDLAKEFNCSKGAIEQILSQNPDILQLRKLRRYFDKRKEMRSSLLATRDCLQKPRRQTIKKTNNKAYMWLFRNDKDWLYAHLPDAIPRKYRYALFEREINFNAVQQASENKESK